MPTRTLILALVITACGSSSTPPPDATSDALPPQREIHDLGTSCDVTWNPHGPPPSFCELACVTKPSDVPCTGTPCNDHASCTAAQDATEKMDCPVSFLISDDAGQHRGCCLLRVTSAGAVPSFFECPQI